MTKKLAYLTLASAALIGFSLQTTAVQNTPVSAQETSQAGKVPITINYVDDFNNQVVETRQESITAGSTIYIQNYGYLGGYDIVNRDQSFNNVQANQILTVKVLKVLNVQLQFTDEFQNVIGTNSREVTRGESLISSIHGLDILPSNYLTAESSYSTWKKPITTEEIININVIRVNGPVTTKISFVDDKGTVIGTQLYSGKANAWATATLPEDYKPTQNDRFENNGIPVTIKITKSSEQSEAEHAGALYAPLSVVDENGKEILKTTISAESEDESFAMFPNLPGKYRYVPANLSNVGSEMGNDDYAPGQDIKNEKPITVTAIDMAKFTHITYNDLAGNILGDKYIKDPGNGTINISTNVPAGYHLSSQQPAVIPAHNGEDWNVLVSNQPETSSVSTVTKDPVQPSQSTSQPAKSATDIEKMNGTATITAKAGALVFGDANTSKQLGSSLPAGSKWRIFSVRRDNGDTYSYNLGGGQWIKASDALINDTPVAKLVSGKKEIKASGTFVVRIPGKPKWSTVLWTADGKATSKFLKAGSSWKTHAKKTINGHVYYRLGSQKQWVRADYGYLK